MATVSWEEKIAKATENATKKAEKEGLDEETSKILIEEAVQKVLEAKSKVESKEELSKYVITVDNNATFCGIGAGGVQFANGKAIIENKRMVEWFEEHEGYSVRVE